MLESKKIDTPVQTEIELHVDTYRESEISYPLPGKHELDEQNYNHHFEEHYPLVKPTAINGEN